MKNYRFVLGPGAEAHAPRMKWDADSLGSMLSRRSLIVAGLLAPMLTLSGCEPTQAPEPKARVATFFTAAERSFVDAATARLIPDGEDGLGARGAAVTFFIDRQLAGRFGNASDWYMQGPWGTGTPEQGYQSRHTPAQLYRAAIAALEGRVRHDHGGKTFAQLPADAQDALLQRMEKGDMQLGDVDAKSFFKLLLQNTKEGFFADPMYGGNRNFTGWRLIGFPGPRYNYVAEITQYGQRYRLPTVGLLGRDGSLIKVG